MKNEIRNLNRAKNTQMPQIPRKKKSTDTSDNYGDTDRDTKGRFLRGNKVAMKTHIGLRARFERLPDMQEKQLEFERIDALMERIRKNLPDTPKVEMALEFLSDGLNFSAQMKLAFRKTAETIDEAAYRKSGVVVPHGCLEAWTKISQEVRRWAKSVGINMDETSAEESEPETLLDKAKRRG